jgi:hypothetical protein
MTDDRDEGKDVAKELRRVREEVRRRALLGDAKAPPVATESPVREPRPPASKEAEVAVPPPAPPRTEAVNEGWRAEPRAPRGLFGLAFRVLDRLLRPRFDAQRDWNAAQVQLDNDFLRYVDARSDATHRHYDKILGLYGRHLGEIDERHMILQEELVAHVEDLVRRIDLVLSESDRGRLSLEFALEDVRARLVRLEESLRRR